MMIEEMVAVMQAFNDGKEIQFKFRSFGEKDWTDCTKPTWNWDTFDYRIKLEEPKPKYQQYESIEEMIEDYCLRFKEEYFEYELPWIWLQSQGNNGFNTLITVFDFENDEVSINGEFFGLEELFEYYTYIDGSPCGKLV